MTSAAIGSAYLAAWLLGAGARWSAAGVLTMKTNMALCLLLSGVALMLVEPRRATSPRRAVGAMLAATVVLVGGLTLLEHVFDADFGIDQLLATEAAGAVATVRPNRFGLPGSVSLVLVGVGLLALAARRRVASYFALATAVVVFVPAVGFLSRIGPLYREAVTGIAWLTVVAVLLLAAGLFAAEGREGPLGLVWSDGPGGKLLRHVLPAAVLAPLVLQMLRRVGEFYGLYGHPVGVGILLISFIFVMSGFLWRSAAQLDAESARARGSEATARWRADLLDLVSDAIMVWSPAGGVEGWHEGAEELYGYTTAEAVGRDPHDLLRTEALRPLTDLEEEVQRAGRWEGELRHRTKDGRELVVSSKWRSVRGIDGRERVLEVNRDITGRKQMEEELRDSGRRKDEFLSLLSHELRNPLAPISNALFILERAEPAGQQARRAKEVIARQVGHLTRLVDDLLEVTRITRGKVQLRRTRLDLGELVRRTGEDYRDLLRGRGLELALHTPDRAVWVDGDETRLAQVVGNLLLNAAKFTPAGGKVSLSVVAADEKAELHVSDTGIGIAPTLLAHVFDPFVQAEQTLARIEGGLGLGLALVKGVVELHGGSVEARSAGRGLGAEFVVHLATVPPPDVDRADAVRVRGPHRVLRVLVVDDNADAAESLAELVRMFGHEVQVAYDGPSAIATATATSPNLVLCDIGLPGVDGYEVARTLRSNPDLQSTRLVAVTGYAQPDDIQRATEAGFVGHLAKPPDPDVLERYLG